MFEMIQMRKQIEEDLAIIDCTPALRDFFVGYAMGAIVKAVQNERDTFSDVFKQHPAYEDEARCPYCEIAKEMRTWKTRCSEDEEE